MIDQEDEAEPGRIRCNTSRNRFIVVNSLLKAGFKRVGIAKTFVHADDSGVHDQGVMWLY